MRYFLFAVLCMFMLSGCFAGISDFNSASDEQLINNLKWSGTIWTPLGETNKIVTELRSRHPEWNWDNITRGRINTGMTESEAILSWGHPHKVNHASYGDQWVYRRGNYHAQYLYFERGILQSFNEN